MAKSIGVVLAMLWAAATLFVGGEAASGQEAPSPAVTGRAEIPDDAATVMLNVAAVSPSGHGYLTVYPCGQRRPFASALTCAPGDVRAVAVPARVGRDGTVCVFSKAATDLVVDVSGYVASG